MQYLKSESDNNLFFSEFSFSFSGTSDWALESFDDMGNLYLTVIISGYLFAFFELISDGI